VSRIGLRGWTSIPDSADPVQVRILVDGVEEARIPARLPREDVQRAGHSVTGRCGFEFVWQSPLPDEKHGAVRVLAGPEGQGLPLVAGGTPISLYGKLSAVPDGWPRTIVVASREPLPHPALQQSIPMHFDPA